VTVLLLRIAEVGWAQEEPLFVENSPECHEIICVEKAATEGPSTQQQTSGMLYEAFRTHVKLKHSEDFNIATVPATERHEA
jgi:hypothetical protein